MRFDMQAFKASCRVLTPEESRANLAELVEAALALERKGNEADKPARHEYSEPKPSDTTLVPGDSQ